MTKDNPFEFSAFWYDIWLKQSKDFMATAEKSLKQIFDTNAYTHPQDYMEQIKHWQESLKKEWQHTQFQHQQKAVEDYWKWMMKMCSEATDKTVQDWMKAAKEQHPIKNIQELYALWLNCCHEVYQQSTSTASYQKAYGDMMNSALEFWKTAMKK